MFYKKTSKKQKKIKKDIRRYLQKVLTLKNQLVTRTGFEPIHACVKGMCVKPFHQRAMYLNNQARYIITKKTNMSIGKM